MKIQTKKGTTIKRIVNDNKTIAIIGTIKELYKNNLLLTYTGNGSQIMAIENKGQTTTIYKTMDDAITDIKKRYQLK